MENRINYLVRVSCMTFNHAPFIVDTMNGFTMQHTNFPFVCTIFDDASTDSEQDVIRQYMNDYFDLDDKSVYRNEETDDYVLMFARHLKNKNCFFAVFLLKYNHYSIKKSKKPYIKEWECTKYIALCEGDDHWIHPQKLQLQIDFLEKHSDYSMCHGDAEYFVYEKNWNKGRLGKIYSKGKSYDSPNPKNMFYGILTKRYPSIVTCTACFRVDFYNKIPANTRTFMMGDMPLWLDLSQLGRIKYFDEVFGVYVKHQGSATRSSNTRLQFTLNSHEMKLYYCGKYNYSIPPKIVKLYKKAYLELFYSGVEMPIVNIAELSDFPNKVKRIKKNTIYKEIERMFLNFSSYTLLIKEKFMILYLYFLNIIWRFFR